MKRFAAVALVPLFAGYLFAQSQQTRTETTTTTTWNGSLVDAGCYTTHANREVTESEPNKTKTTQTTTETTECPVTTTTTTFGLVTPEGKYVRFDEPSNTRVIEVVKTKKWDKSINEKKPVRVRVVGSTNGDVVVIKTIQ